ncbi:MAG: hypothetical protein K6E84_10645 [Lachnospiraceae bacterium]|nr:hypothetical protein [Lachnospiraceae bacterium]
MSDERKAREEIIEKYRPEVERFSAYIPWLTEKCNIDVSQNYTPEGGRTIQFPVYDSTLLRFVKEMDQSIFIDKNYPYVYSRYGVKTLQDEFRLIDQVQIMNISVLGGIMSRYIIGGRTKGRLWSEGVQNGVFLKALEKARELIEFWSHEGQK